MNSSRILVMSLLWILVTPVAAEVTLVGAGDIASKKGLKRARLTGKIVQEVIDSANGYAFVLGDNAYRVGSKDNFTKWYEPTWGGFRRRTYPAVGNHEAGYPLDSGDPKM